MTDGYSGSGALSQLRRVTLERLTNFFGYMGSFSERSPLLAILFCVFVTFLFGGSGLAGVTGGVTMETNSFELWVPRSMMAYKNYKYTSENFLDSQRGIVMLYYPKDGGDALRPEYMLEALSIHKNITEHIVGKKEDDATYEGVGFNTICQRVSVELPCEFFNILGVFNYDAAAIQATADAGKIHSSIKSFGDSGAPLKMYLGGIENDENTGNLTSASVIRMVWGINSENTTDPLRSDIKDLTMDFEATIQDTFLWDWRDTSSRLGKIDLITTRSIDDEIGRLIQVDSALFVMSIFAIVAILSFSLIKCNSSCMTNSRMVVASAAFVIIMFSIVFSFGMMAHFGLPINSICTLICFVVAGVGVDDMIVVENFFQKAIDNGIPRGKRMDYALRHGGLSVFLTSSSSVLAFLSGVGLDIPGIAQFCTVGALCFSWIWFQSITFFPAVLVLDQRRIEAQKCQCICCTPALCVPPAAVADGDEGDKKDPAVVDKVESTKVGEILTPILTSKLARILVPLLFAGLAGINGYATTLNSTGLSVADVVPDDSYIIELTETTDLYWTGKIIRGLQIVFKGDHYSDMEKVADMNEYFDWVQGLDYIVGTVGGSQSTWYKEYVSYLQSKSLDPYDDFSDNLVDFLAEPATKKWRSQVTCTTDYDTCTAIKCAQFHIVQTSKIDTFELYGIQMELNDKIVEMGFPNAYAFIDEFGYADADSTIEKSVLVTLSIAVAVVCALMCGLMDTGSAVCIFICVLFIDIDLLGMLYFWDVKLSSVAFTGLVMSIGLSVDYNVHIAHAFIHGKGNTLVEKTKNALDEMGVPVLKGGLTTFIGTVVLSAASSTAFRIFFKVCFGTVVFGVLHGMLLMPVLLGLYVELFGVLKIDSAKVSTTE